MSDSLNSSHFVKQLQKQSMQVDICVGRVAYELQQSREGSLFVHSLKRFLVLLAIEEQECRDDVQNVGAIFLPAIRTMDRSRIRGAMRTWRRPKTICRRTYSVLSWKSTDSRSLYAQRAMSYSVCRYSSGSCLATLWSSTSYRATTFVIRRETEVRPQGIINQFMSASCRGHDLIELFKSCC